MKDCDVTTADVEKFECGTANLNTGWKRNGMECIVSVPAQIMCWDETYSGWVAFSGGGVSMITLLQKLVQPDDYINTPVIEINNTAQPCGLSERIPKYEYLLHGRRIVDQKVLLECCLQKESCFKQIMPTFQHWEIGSHKFGLSFKTNFDACIFHNRVQKAIEHTLTQSKSSSGESNLDDEDLEDEVFAPVDLPLSRQGSLGSAGTPKSTSSVSKLVKPSHKVHTPLIQPTIISSKVHKPSEKMSEIMAPAKEQISSVPPARRERSSGKTAEQTSSSGMQPSTSRDQAIGQSSALNRKTLLAHESKMPSLKIPYGIQPVLLPLKQNVRSDIICRERCCYCNIYYTTRDNRPGVCTEAPNKKEIWLRRISCIGCVDCCLYCCMKDEDGERPRTGSATDPYLLCQASTRPHHSDCLPLSATQAKHKPMPSAPQPLSHNKRNRPSVTFKTNRGTVRWAAVATEEGSSVTPLQRVYRSKFATAFRN